jgi:hypothetical protein
MTAAPICITCNRERTLIGITPGRNRHDVRSYECPDCKDVFRLVVERMPMDSDEPVREEPALKAGAR